MMTSLLRLLKVVYRLNNSTKTTIFSKNLGKSSTFETLSHLQSVHLSKQAQKYASFDSIKLEKPTDNDSIFEQIISDLSKEIFYHGIITKFNVDSLLEEVKQSGTISSLQGLFLLRCCSELITDKSPMLRKQLGDEIWKTLSEIGVNLDVSHYNALLDIYLESEFDFSPFDFLEMMSKANVKPNRVTFQKLISQFCNQGKVEEAMNMIDTLSNEQISENVYSSFIHGHLINGNLDAAYEVLNNMKKNGISTTAKTYAIFLYDYAKKGELDRVKDIIDECKRKEIDIPDKIFLNVVYNFAVNGYPEYTDQILSITFPGQTYSKEANKIMYKLIEKQQEDVAFKVLQTVPKNNLNPSKKGNFFLKTLINFNTPTDKVIEFYRLLKEDGLINPQNILSAIHQSFANDMYETSMTLMKTWKEIEGTIREYYFYRILKNYGEGGRTEEVLKVVERMILEFKINPSIFTLKNYVLPYMEGKAEDLLFPLVYRLVNIETAANAILLKLLSENKIREAIRFMSINIYLPFNMLSIQTSLLEAYKNTEDTPSFVWIIHNFYKKSFEKDPTVNWSKKFVDTCMLEAIKLLAPNKKYLIVTLLKSSVERGLSLSPETAAEIEQLLDTEMMSEVTKYLNLLKSGDLIPQNIIKENFSEKRLKNIGDIEKLENIVKVLTPVNEASTKFLKKILMHYYCRTSNEIKAKELIEELEIKDKSLSYSVYDRLISMYVYSEKIKEAEEWLEKSRKVSGFQLKKNIILKWATKLVKENQLEEAQNCFNWKSHEIPPSGKNIDELLSAVSKHNSEELLDKFYKLLETNEFLGHIDLKKLHLFKHYVLFHLDRGETESAVEKFEWLYKKYNKSPCIVELLKKFVNNGDEKLLERVKNISIKVCGEIATYVDLAIINLENGDLDLAESILKNHCPNLQERKIFHYAEKYYRINEINKLERLFYILNNLNYDVENLCILLLKSYSLKNKWEDGYNLWMRMQNSDMITSKNFINCFNLIMNDDTNEKNKILDEFHKAVDDFDLKKAANMLERVPMLFKNDCYSELCEMYAKSNCVSSAVDCWKDLKVRFNLDLKPLAAEVVLSKILEKNDIENVEKIDSFLDPYFKNQSFFSTFYNQVYLQAGAWNLFLKNLETKLDDGILNSKNLSLYMNNRTVVDSLMKHPELSEQYESLAFKFFLKNMADPLVMLWTYYFLEKNPKADELWEKFIKYRHTVSCEEFFYFSRMKNDADLNLKLANIVVQSSITRRAKLAIYTQLLKNCMKMTHSEKFEYALKCLECGLLDFSMQEFNLDLLVNLQAGLEKSGICWPWSTRPVIA